MGGRYFTISAEGTSEYKEKGSKFLGMVFHVVSEEQVKEKLLEVKKAYYDARHHCYAYILGMEDQLVRANDDGEPNHSAGDPILGQIRSLELTDCLVIVVRYFGGTKLGVGGLVNAYKMAAKEALEHSERKEIFPMLKVKLAFPYSSLGFVERLVSDVDAEVLERDFKEDCMMFLRIKKSLHRSLERAVIDHPQIVIVNGED